MSDDRSAALQKLTNEIVIGLVICIGIFALLSYFGWFNPKYDYVPPDLNQNATLSNVYYKVLSNGSVIFKKVPFDEPMSIIVVYHTTSLSAQNPIDINAKLLVDRGAVPKEEWNSFPTNFILIFPKSLQEPKIELSNGRYMRLVQLF